MARDDDLTLLACQLEIPRTQDSAARDRHLDTQVAKVRNALRRDPVDLVVLPELSSIDYSREVFDRLDRIAEPLDGASFQAWRGVATEFGVHVSYGFARRDATGTYIAIAVVAPDGTLVGHYDKLHICQYGASMEKEYFDCGDHVFTFDVGGFTIAPIICYDIRIPELSRVLTLKHGVDLILHCGAYFRDESFATWHDFTTTRAMENQVYLLSLNRAGPDWGNSRLCLPWMDETTPPVCFAQTGEELRRLTLTRQALGQARQDYTFLKDRLDDYDQL